METSHFWVLLAIALIASVSIGFVISSNGAMTGNAITAPIQKSVTAACDKDGICDSGETAANCPTDCKQVTIAAGSNKVSQLSGFFNTYAKTYGIDNLAYGHQSKWFTAYNNIFNSAYDSYKKAGYSDAQAFDLASGYAAAAWQSGIGESENAVPLDVNPGTASQMTTNMASGMMDGTGGGSSCDYSCAAGRGSVNCGAGQACSCWCEGDLAHCSCTS